VYRVGLAHHKRLLNWYRVDGDILIQTIQTMHDIIYGNIQVDGYRIRGDEIMDYEVTEHVDHFVCVNDKKEVEVNDLTWYNIKVEDLSKEELDDLIVVIKPLYEKHIQEEIKEEKEHDVIWSRKYKADQCKGGL
jgi:hypothetical protein